MRRCSTRSTTYNHRAVIRCSTRFKSCVRGWTARDTCIDIVIEICNGSKVDGTMRQSGGSVTAVRLVSLDQTNRAEALLYDTPSLRSYRYSRAMSSKTAYSVEGVGGRGQLVTAIGRPRFPLGSITLPSVTVELAPRALYERRLRVISCFAEFTVLDVSSSVPFSYCNILRRSI
ncbi:hypothetical protein EVAR_30125_1 [Eumeta japonica]|uniref:Uncharacterized protein n=1 Tax=Eumeta variegata TaxID=151549 RepID=A0A4C1WJS8_EUMVA|nr:hypothetical protein EVAR_30125_1 [Eumeta japonica]